MAAWASSVLSTLWTIDFPGHAGAETLEEISWDDFFQKFDCANLAMISQDATADDTQSRFCKFVNRDRTDDGGPLRIV